MAIAPQARGAHNPYGIKGNSTDEVAPTWEVALCAVGGEGRIKLFPIVCTVDVMLFWSQHPWPLKKALEEAPTGGKEGTKQARA